MTIITRSNRDQYLRNRPLHYCTGWLDAERGEKSQVVINCDADEINLTVEQNNYYIGYQESMDNQFTMEGN